VATNSGAMMPEAVMEIAAMLGLGLITAVILRHKQS